ncbi:MAG: hypothetical protein DWQ02_16575, partial [Bacteroidetes bacterium]
MINLSEDTYYNIGKWVEKKIDAMFPKGETEEEKRERRRQEREWEREERKWRLEQKREERRQREEERKREFELKKQKRAIETKNFLSEHFGIEPPEQIKDRIHPKQLLFVLAVEAAIKEHRDGLGVSYSLELPILDSEGNCFLVEQKRALHYRLAPQYRILKEYDGEPLRPRFGYRERPLEVRKTALKKLITLY